MRLAVNTLSRRAALQLAPLLYFAVPGPAPAFENRLPPDELELKYKTPRTPGPKPTDLGVQNGGLKPCVDGKPHCFSSSKESFEDNDLFNADYGEAEAGWLVEPIKYKGSVEEAFAAVREAVAAYPPGQRGIDGGGFKEVAATSSGGGAYVYVQFESQRKGYVDDMEFGIGPAAGGGGTVNVRTSSRLGYLDYGVNAKRFCWFAERLGSLPGWAATPLRAKGHEEYFSLNGLTDKDLAAR